MEYCDVCGEESETKVCENCEDKELDNGYEHPYL